MKSFPYGSLVLYIICSVYIARVIHSPLNWHIIDGMNLVMHEAGHILFSPFGEFLHILGGSLLQVIIPCLFAAYFFAKQQYIESAVLLLWCGQSLVNVSIYIGDAQALELPLLGGDMTTHDWNTLLSMMNALGAAKPLSGFVYILGISIAIGSACLIAWKEVIKRI